MFVKPQTEHNNIQKLRAAQLFIQKNLTEDLSLKIIANKIGLSSSYFHNLFKHTFNETPKTYVSRLRIEKSYYAIRVTNDSLLKIALDHGFKNPETFSRAYSNHFKTPPSSVPRIKYLNPLTEQPTTNHVEYLDQWAKSNTSELRLVYLNPIKLIYKRHVGPYENVPYVSDEESQWHALHEQSQNPKTPRPTPVFIGIPLDNPLNTPAEKLRYDMCVLKTANQSNDLFEYKTLPAGFHAVLTHAGCYADLSETYQRLYATVTQLHGFQIATKPPFEVLIDVSAKTPTEHTWTDLYLPVIKTATE